MGACPAPYVGGQAQNPGVVLTMARRQSQSLRSDGDGDRLGGDLLLRDGLTRVMQVVKVEPDRLLGVLDTLDHGLPFGDAPRQSGHRDGVTAVLGVRVEQDRVGRQPTHASRLQKTRRLIASDLCGLKDCRERLRLENPAGMNRAHHSRSGTLDGGTLVLGGEESPSVVLRLAPWRAWSVARVLEEWSAVSRVFHRAPRPVLNELELSRTLDLAASPGWAILGSNQ